MDMNKALSAAVELPGTGQAPDWIHLLPAGSIEGRDGRTFLLGSPQEVIASSLTGAYLPIDYEHQLDDPATRPNDGIVAAAGWIKELEARGDGIWGRVEWTDKARNMIAARAYRYLSPVLTYVAQDGRVISLLGASLVHRPNLRLTALSNARLPAPAEDASMALVKATLGLKPDTDTATVIAAMQDRLTPDPTRYVPIEAVADLLKDRNSKMDVMKAREAEAKMDDATERGYLTPAMRGWAIALCKSSPESFDAFLSSATPAYAHLFRPAVRGAPPQPSGHTGDPDSIAAQLGIDQSRLLQPFAGVRGMTR